MKMSPRLARILTFLHLDGLFARYASWSKNQRIAFFKAFPNATDTKQE